MKKKKTPYLYVLLSFLAIIIIGTFLFILPISTVDRRGLSFIDALFMSTTSVCVTGLSVVPNVGTSFSLFGKVVMAILIEIGGLSILTLASFILSIIGVKFGMSQTLLMREALNQNSAKELKPLIKSIVIFALLIQLIGAIVNLFVFIPIYGVSEGIGISIFHSISSFNNAGLDIFGYTDSMVTFKDNVFLNVSTMLLIILGGIGFIVIKDIVTKHNLKKFSLHTKIVLITTIFLIITGFIFIKLTSFNSVTWLQALFTSVTSRTAGFSTVDVNKLSNASYFITLFLMFIGASPCSTGGGIKTTTIFIVIIAIISLSRGKKTNLFNRNINSSIILKAYSLITLSIILLATSTVLLSFFEPGMAIKDLLFESVSAFGTVGLSMGITPSLNSSSKMVIIITMFLGRIGPLTVLNMWNNNWLKNTNEQVRYIDEKIIVG